MNPMAKKLGYYTVGNFQTFQKFLAVKEHQRTKAGVKWHFNDDVLNSYDWTCSNNLDLDKLYRQRAEQLRNTYDYLVLFYSGGSDSQTVLDIFIKYNIHIDEIATCWSLKGAKSVDAYFNQEIYHVAIPYLESIKQKIPQTEFRLIDQTDLILNDFTKPDWFLDHSNFLTPNCVTRSKLRETIPKYRKLLDQGVNLGFIWGRDKPSILTDSAGIIYTQFNDYVDNNTSAYSQKRWEQGWHDEFFYQSPDTVALMIAQCQTVVNRLQEKSIPAEFFQDKFSANGQCPHTKRYLTTRGLSYVIYPSWNYEVFSNGKNVSNCWGQRDDWFFQRYMHTSAYKNWLNGINTVYLTYYHPVDSENWLNSQSIFDNIKGVLGPRFNLTKNPIEGR